MSKGKICELCGDNYEDDQVKYSLYCSDGCWYIDNHKYQDETREVAFERMKHHKFFRDRLDKMYKK